MAKATYPRTASATRLNRRIASVRRMILHLLLVCTTTGLFVTGATATGIKVGVSNSPLSTPFYVAEKLGYFRSEGLEVIITDCAGGNVCFKQLLDGNVHLATTSDLPIMFRSFDTTSPFSVIATFASSSQDIKLIARKSAGIKSTKDLKGKQVALVRGAAGQYVFDLALLADGIDPRAATLIDIDLKQLDKAAANPKIDAFALWNPGAYQMIKMLGSDAFVIPAPNLYTLTFNLVMLNDQSAIPATDLVKFLRALDRAISYIKSDPASSKALLQERLKLDASDVAAFWPDYRFSLSLNQSLLTTLESTARWAIQEKLVKGNSVPDYLEMIDVRPLKQFRASAVSLIK